MPADVWNPRTERWEGDNWATLVELKRRIGSALLYDHYTPGHSAGGDQEYRWWLHMTTGYAPQGIPRGVLRGNLAQLDIFDDPEKTGREFEQTAIRLDG